MTKRSVCACGTERVITVDAIQRPRLRCPRCDGIAAAPKRRAMRTFDELPATSSPFVSEGEE